MSFKLIHSNKFGTFKLKLNRDLSADEINEVCRIATALVPCPEEVVPKQVVSEPVYGPETQSVEHRGQRYLGERPVDRINMGNYVEPYDGVRIKMLYFVVSNRVDTIKAFARITGIPVTGSYAIISGNYKCPILKPEVAAQVLEEFKKLDVYAKVVPAFSDDDGLTVAEDGANLDG